MTISSSSSSAQGQPLNAFTIDLEEWYQGLTSTNPQVDRWPLLESRVEIATRRLLTILRAHRVCATVFVLGHVADHHPTLIEEIAADGHEIAVHGYYHRFVSRLTAGQFRVELEDTIRAIERITGQPPIGHRAPYFSINASTGWAFGCLQEMGLHYDSSVFPTRNMLYGFPGAPRFPYRIPHVGLLEFPVSTIRRMRINWPVSGGFYLRILPYVFIRWALRQINREGQPVILYTHPWEVDTGQVYPQVTARERITHYHGRKGLEEKLHRLLSDFRFTTLQKLMASAKW